MYFRPFQLADYYGVTSLLETVLSEECYDQTIQALTRQLTLDSGLVLVASNEERIAGVIIGTVDNNRGYYYRVAVHPEHRNQGIAKSLISSLKGRFEQRKVSRIMVTADPHNEAMLKLYGSFGFEPKDFERAFQKLSIVAG